MFSFKKILRLDKWWEHILPPIFLFYYTGLYQPEPGNSHPLGKAIILALISILTAFAGYFLNDLFDISDDRKAGKSNYVSSLSTGWRISFLPLLLFLVLCILVISFCLDLISMSDLVLFTGVFLLNLIFFLLYSLRKTRFKEIMFLAPVMDALYSGTFFYILAYLLSHHNSIFESRTGWKLTANGFPLQETLMIAGIFLWGLCKGLRNYLYHLAEDRENDELSGLKTLATRYGPEPVYLAANCLFPVEAGIMIGLQLAFTGATGIWASGFCILFLGFWVKNMRTGKYQKKDIYNDLHEVWLPVTLLFLLFLQMPQYYPFLILHIILFPYHLPKIYFSLKKVIFVLFKFEWTFRKK